ncbi:quinol monooxygenase YgiN [Sphingomonas naasensis]|uniref:Antibiotic biosynthesis monooxygenase n=1 Tax=Sphingomonas naasensis TaxID=1344951 RepID=A0A4S1WLS5_9SPHN|nr:putative quinol monooxygenase [Sphingomonas naasensis]NIJ20086.1 quinol monooxygenase YgiN [Sphingomonas naasensis]TGX44244.1 antibiotic biosynthesis monooxygenase [Sphingomonas naasensis]
MTARRPVLAGLALAMLGGGALAKGRDMEDPVPFGMIGKMKALPGKRAELIAILSSGTGAMPGCRAYLIAEDAKDPDAIWITEIWDDASSHKASLQLPAVRAAIAKGRPLIAGFELSVETRPVAGSFVAHG